MGKLTQDEQQEVYKQDKIRALNNGIASIYSLIDLIKGEATTNQDVKRILVTGLESLGQFSIILSHMIDMHSQVEDD